jgi:hypothetical protein
VLDPRSLRIVAGPFHGTARVSQAAVVYRSQPGFAGADRFVYEVCAGSRRVDCTRAEVLVDVQEHRRLRLRARSLVVAARVVLV